MSYCYMLGYCTNNMIIHQHICNMKQYSLIHCLVIRSDSYFIYMYIKNPE